MDALYQSQLLAYARTARSQTPLGHVTHSAFVRNPTCGDEVMLSLCVNDNVISDIHVDVKGCALCEAGGGLMIEAAKGAKLSEIAPLHQELKDYLAQHHDASDGRFTAFEAVQNIKNRHKCVLLAFEAYHKATQ